MMTTKRYRPRRKPKKLTNSARVTMTALSLIGFVGGWNMIGRLESGQAQAEEQPATPALPSPTATMTPSPTAWPTVSPLAEIPPVPTLMPTFTTFEQGDADVLTREQAGDSTAPVTNLAPLSIVAPFPTLAPLPDMPTPPPPPPPPVPVQQQSGGS